MSHSAIKAASEFKDQGNDSIPTPGMVIIPPPITLSINGCRLAKVLNTSDNSIKY